MTQALPLRFHATHEAAAAPTCPSAQEESLLSVAPHAELTISVIIPAKDEAANLPATLAALAAQIDLNGCPLPPHSYEVIVLANNCRDATARVARQVALTYPQLVLHVVERTLPPAEAHVGKARRLLMDEAARRLRAVGRPQGIIASTDADTRVAPDWLATTAAAVAAGADAVGGRILTDAPTAHRCSTRRYQLRDAAYNLLAARLEHRLDPIPADPWPRHHQHFGASLALTAAAYAQVGGLPVVPYLEDEALYQALYRHDLRVRHSPAVRVLTSGRHEGRVAVGLSAQLREWAALGQREPLVASGYELAAIWRARHQLRQLWQQASLSRPLLLTMLPVVPTSPVKQVAATLGLDGAALSRQLLLPTTFGLLWEWALREQAAGQQWTSRWPRVPLRQALTELRTLVND